MVSAAKTLKSQVSGWWNEKPSTQESFEAVARTAEETQEAHQRKLQYGVSRFLDHLETTSNHI